MGTTPPLLQVEILEDMKNPIMLKSYVEYIEDNKTFMDLKKI